MAANDQAQAFAHELKALIQKHYGTLDKEEVEPFGMELRKALPVSADAVTGSVTTTATISLPLDTDPPDQDD